MSNLTAEQWAYMDKRLQKKKDDIVKPYETLFGLNKWDCEKYFNVTNETFSKPICRVEKVKGDKAYVRALFSGSGILSHPVRYAWIPFNELRETVQISLTVYYYFKIKNWIKKLLNIKGMNDD